MTCRNLSGNERVTSFFDDSNGLPAAGDPSEYSAAFEAVFPDPADRRRYIEDAVRKGVPSFGHRVLASLVTAGAARILFTTNFDPLIERATTVSDEAVAAEHRAHLLVGALDSVERASRAFAEGASPILVKLHGDYQSVQLKNTDDELKRQDELLRRILVDATAQTGLVVVGYSGRDESVMSALDEAVSRSNGLPNALWWVKRPGDRALARVDELFDRAEQAGVDAYIVESENFDELMGDIEREVTLGEELRGYIDQQRPAPIVRPVAMPTLERADFPVVRCSALQILQLPDVAAEIAVDESLTSRRAREMVKEANVWATVASRGSTLIGFGADADIATALRSVGGKATGTRTLIPDEDMVDRGLLYDAMTRAIARQRSLRAILRGQGHTLVVRPPSADRTDARAEQDRDELSSLANAYGGKLEGMVPKVDRRFAEAIEIHIEEWDGRWWCVFKPYTWVDLPRRPRSDDNDPKGIADFEVKRNLAADWNRERWARRYNPWWNEAIAAWAKLIAPEVETPLSAHRFDGPGLRGAFRISSTTAWTRPARQPRESVAR